MNYVQCLKNNTYFKDDDAQTFSELIVGDIYKALPATRWETEHNLIRVIDRSGEGYLFPQDYFAPVEQQYMDELASTATVHLSRQAKVELRTLADRMGVSMSELLRDWIEERLDLPTA